MTATATNSGARLPMWGWISLALLVAIVLTAAYLWQRKPIVVERTVPGPVAAVSDELARKAATLRAANDALAAEIAELKRRIVDQLCPPGLIKKAESPSTGTGPSQSGNAARVAAPSTAPATVTSAPAKPMAMTALGALLEKSTALVLTEDSSGSGFFIAPDLLVTNRHVVEESKTGKVLVTSKSLGAVRPARIVAVSPSSQTGGADFALLQMGGSGPTPTPLPLATTVDKLQPVVAAGYPGLSLMNDPGFRRLIDGDGRAAPDLNLTTGTVQSLQESPAGGRLVLHTATVLQGNSGGPLVDQCGRVVGVNTFIAVDQEQSGRNSYALAAPALIGFLTGQKVGAAVASGPCG